MIKRNEIRIGNMFFWSDDVEWIVDENNFKITVAGARNLLLKPVLLTSDLLDSKGFKYDAKRNRYYLNNKFKFMLYKVAKSFFLCEHNNLDARFHEIKLVEAFHQLQNLYLDLTGEELKVKKGVVNPG